MASATKNMSYAMRHAYSNASAEKTYKSPFEELARERAESGYGMNIRAIVTVATDRGNVQSLREQCNDQTTYM